MVNETSEFPGGMVQVRNLLRSRSEVKGAKAQYETGSIQSVILYGLETLIPNEVKDSGILTNPDRRTMVDDLITYQLRLNDRIDFSNMHGQEMAEITREVIQRESDAKVQLEKSLSKLHAPELEKLIGNASAEVEKVEAYIASRKGNLSYDDIEKYRNIVNAISNCIVTRAILGTNHLANRLPILPDDQMNWQGIFEKYQWILGSEPSNDVERTVLIMHNLAMAAQIDDDWYGRHIDRAMGLETFATAALEEKAQDPIRTQEFLNNVKTAYLMQAKKLGLNPVAVFLIDTLQEKRQQLMSWEIRKARYSENSYLKEYLNEKVVPTMGSRERAYVAGKI